MDNIKTVKIDDLLGTHILTGVETDYAQVPAAFGIGTDRANVIRFILDGIIYSVFEDPNDGYRSSMGDIFIDGEVKNVFDPVEVVCEKKADDEHENFDVLLMINPLISKVVVEFGTENIGDYYPSFVGSFYPVYLTEATYAKALLENIDD
jgi:hypothetical protein